MTGINDLGAAGADLLNIDTALPVAELLRLAKADSQIAIHVPSFSDGRVFSQVRALSECPWFRGRVTVHGDLLPEQADLLSYFGVVDVVLCNGLDLADRPTVPVRGSYRERRGGALPASDARANR